MTRYTLKYATPQAWIDTVLNDFDAFLIDHAAAEKKASGMAVSMLSHYPDKAKLVEAMSDLAIEEMVHFRDVVKLIHQRGLMLAADTKDEYINAFRQLMRKGTDVYFLDRLLVGSIVEARGCERFGLIAEALPAGDLKKFYLAITESERRHDDLFLTLAYEYFQPEQIEPRLQELLNAEADIMKTLPILAQLH
ncbi:tRNA-(ms[2]io[6]A)-hydroxylase [Marinagarivorans cellulosilyticus]|uniref:tRNA-(Ms[2]io[6]A)-hydroxylase n=1 Tax=Marinagarivorans cellulosilyticus TaxID=2721545 RepID=A0AAN2BJF1_9GAMM|nr:tRNA-(ms[2]io[6]A)-hydroxylase [Marinagarivorans cellulosilyticus]BCD96918.1 tRNA-(ms[2]io[6]A)-hydroxylase [Marinagarivorans cellulosilyticus]